MGRHIIEMICWAFVVLMLFTDCRSRDTNAKSTGQTESVTTVPQEETGDTSDVDVAPIASDQITAVEPKGASVGSNAKKLEEPDAKTVEPQKNKRSPKPAPKKRYYAKMTFDSTVHHLPPVTEGDNFKSEFRFVNTGDVPLSIEAANASCGCTMPSFPFIDIPVGEKGVIGVDYFSVNKDGPQVAEITILANTRPSATILQLKFDVVPQSTEGSSPQDTLTN